MSSKEFIDNYIDNLTKKELSKYKFLNANSKGFDTKKTHKLSNGTEVKAANSPKNMSLFDNPHEMKEDEYVKDYIGEPKMVNKGKLGFTTYVNPLLPAFYDDSMVIHKLKDK